MARITYIDAEVEHRTLRIKDLGAINNAGGEFHSGKMDAFIHFLSGTEYICGHNIIHHDLKYIGQHLSSLGVSSEHFIDTLYWSALLFPSRPYHALLKEDKLNPEQENNPFQDAVKARLLFGDELAAFKVLDSSMQQIYYYLLHDKIEFGGFFNYIQFDPVFADNQTLIRDHFKGMICENLRLEVLINEHPIELAYCLALIHANSRYSITPPWILKQFPEVNRLMYLLRARPCIKGCAYCRESLDIHKGLKRYFGYDGYREYGGEPLQQKAVQAAVNNQSILVIFPTGGGKSITFQVPALMSGDAEKGLTVVISPLQSLMKDQVDNLEKLQITDAVTINGLLDPIERAKSLERVADGSASLLYISPEALRSNTLMKLLLGRKITRFVIDEAHCFSAWGQDFRVDYQFIGTFIKILQKVKGLEEPIPVSCFTATAKPNVIEDIRRYFKKSLDLDLELFVSKVARTNLHYKVFSAKEESDKYLTLRSLIEAKDCPTIIYVSRTKKADELSMRLVQDGFNALAYHGKMEAREKAAHQNAFISGEVAIMVATSAFGMGVDKKDVGLVIHYEISDSLENYVQEAGRAGRDTSMEADCFILYNEQDLDKHFALLNQTKLSIKEIQQIWQAIKELTKPRPTVSSSALEIARSAGWDDNVKDIETRVKTAIASLENAGYLKRLQDMPRVYANSILARNAEEAIGRINSSKIIPESKKQNAIRIIRKLLSSRSRKPLDGGELAESRVDYIGDQLGILRGDVIEIITLLREEKILADAKDLTAFVRSTEKGNRAKKLLTSYDKMEKYLATIFEKEEKVYNIKELNEKANSLGCEGSVSKLRVIVNFWAINSWIKRKRASANGNHISVVAQLAHEQLDEKIQKRSELSDIILNVLFGKVSQMPAGSKSEEVLVEFSVLELKDAYEKSQSLYKRSITISDIEEAIFYLSRINAIKVEGGFMIMYNQLKIERLELDNRKRYTKENYQILQHYYDQKVQQIHIVGKYAEMMLEEPKKALGFVGDYFQLDYGDFLQKYFTGPEAKRLSRRITATKYQQLFGALSQDQLKIIKDDRSKYIVVLAGPGSGKTRILVHKLAALLLMEDVKQEQLLMLTFSRAAATELKTRLVQLIGPAAKYVEVKTFHSYCFDLLGKVGDIEKFGDLFKEAIRMIGDKDVEFNKITKTVLVLDEAQDMNQEEFDLVKALMAKNEEMRVIAVGDDDQNIYGFRGANSGYLKELIEQFLAVPYSLVENFRSKSNLVDFSNQILGKISGRLKSDPIYAVDKTSGQVKVVRCQTEHMITPLVNSILAAPLKGTTCVLVKTNDDAATITDMLLKKGVEARLIQSNKGFMLSALVELRFFINYIRPVEGIGVIEEFAWVEGKKALLKRYANSTALNLVLNIITSFEKLNPERKFISDFKFFLKESKIEDFYEGSGEAIFVSTIHKAKGKEFDNVFLMLKSLHVYTDNQLREVYVAVTRAKRNLMVYLNSGILDDLSGDAFEWIHDQNVYAEPEGFEKQLSHENLYLGYFPFVQHRLEALRAGDRLSFAADGCLNAKGEKVLKFSLGFLKELDRCFAKGYEVKEVYINFMVFWKGKESNIPVQIILPGIKFGRVGV